METLTLGQLCAQRIVAAKDRHHAAGTVLKMSEVASIIDKTKKEQDLAMAGTDIPPAPEAVTVYSASIGYPLDGQAFCDSYAQKGWIVSGKAKMKDWKSAVRNWKKNGWGHLVAAAKEDKARDYSRF